MSLGDRLRTVDERGHRLWVYADILEGFWRRQRRHLAVLLMAIYLVLPWLRMDGLPFFQLDILGQRLILFNKILGFNETALLIPLIFAFAFTIFALTAVLGRVWCGWACPQTVFLDFLYRPMERLIEGRPSERRALDSRPMDLNKFAKKTLKWSYYALVSFLIANTFIAYFSGRDELFRMMQNSPSENPIFFIFMVLVFAGFLFNFGWFREQMCTIACPYGRLQSVLLDKNSMIVAYDTQRGEPRKQSGTKGTGGDCVDCGRCVQVCPTGIDIRQGLQLECINCAACIDACNLVMSKIKKPQNLILFSSEQKLASKVATTTPRVRPYVYGALALLFSFFALGRIMLRSGFDVTPLRTAASQIIVDGNTVQNQFGFVIKNKTSEPLTISIQSQRDQSSTTFVTAQNPILLKPQEKSEIQVFARFPRSDLKNGLASKVITFTSGNEESVLNLTVFGPEERK